jgi:hypothetical protein
MVKAYVAIGMITLAIASSCGPPTTDLSLSGSKRTVGAQILLDGRSVGVMGVSSQSPDSTDAFRLLTISRGRHDLAIILANGEKLQHVLEPGDYVRVWIEDIGDSLHVSSELD